MIIDAYCHVGLPRFGSVENALTVAKLFGIEGSVLVLGPAVPDYESLFRAIRQYPDRVRGIGVPFGDNERQQAEVADLQVRAGISGIRLSGNDLLKYPSIPDLFGLAGRWIYAVELIDNAPAAEYLLDWLERYPLSRIGAPHFLRSDKDALEGPLRDLVSHARFHPIFSRHGRDSQSPYPHEDLRPWVDAVVSVSGWERIMFGSEYPINFWRDETMPSCLEWVDHFGVTDPLDRFRGATAKRVLFDPEPPEREDVEIPLWIEDQMKEIRPVPLKDGREISMDEISKWQNDYIEALKQDPTANPRSQACPEQSRRAPPGNA